MKMGRILSFRAMKQWLNHCDFTKRVDYRQASFSSLHSMVGLLQYISSVSMAVPCDCLCPLRLQSSPPSYNIFEFHMWQAYMEIMCKCMSWMWVCLWTLVCVCVSSMCARQHQETSRSAARHLQHLPLTRCAHGLTADNSSSRPTFCHHIQLLGD